MGLESRFEQKQSEPTLGVTLNPYNPNGVFTKTVLPTKKIRERKTELGRGSFLAGGQIWDHVTLLCPTC